MKILHNTGVDRVIDVFYTALTHKHHLDLVTPSLSLFAFAALRRELAHIETIRLVVPADETALAVLGTVDDRAARNRLEARWLAQQFAAWLEARAQIRRAAGVIPQGSAVLRDPAGIPVHS